MDKTALKHTDLNVSRICFGAMTFGGQTDEASATRMIDLCKEAGINFLDTANVYNKGASEEMLGRVLGSRRRDFILASKVRNKMGDAHVTTLRASRHHAKLAVNAAKTLADFLFETKAYQAKRDSRSAS